MHCLQYKQNSFELFSQTQHDKRKGGENLSVDDLTLCVPARNSTCSYSRLTIRRPREKMERVQKTAKMIRELERLICSE